jgi:hypothetical protein
VRGEGERPFAYAAELRPQRRGATESKPVQQSLFEEESRTGRINEPPATYEASTQPPAFAANSNAWIEQLDDLAARGYDLSARNPHQGDERRTERPAELTARLLERSRELHNMIESLHAKLSNGNGGGEGEE